MVPVRLTSRWHEIFGEKCDIIPKVVRRERWEKWKQLSIKSNRKKNVDWWSKKSLSDNCLKCKHRDLDWCCEIGLPCSVNPITTFQMNDIGMACSGILFHPKEPIQLELNLTI